MVCPPEEKHVERGERETEVLYIGFELYGDVVLPEGLFAEKDYHTREYLEKFITKRNTGRHIPIG